MRHSLILSCLHCVLALVHDNSYCSTPLPIVPGLRKQAVHKHSTECPLQSNNLYFMSQACFDMVATWIHLSSFTCLPCPYFFFPRGVITSIWLTEYLFCQSKNIMSQTCQGSGVIFSKGFMCLSSHQVSHVLNVAYGITNLYPDQLVYKTLQILDLPDTDIILYLEECSSFIDHARKQVYTHTHSLHVIILVYKI